MKPDHDRFWDGIAGKLREAKGFCPLTPEEAEAAFDAAPEVTLSEGEIGSIITSAVAGDPASWEPEPPRDWSADAEQEGAAEKALQLFRNQGEGDEDTDRIEKDLEEELLNDDDAEEEDGV